MCLRIHAVLILPDSTHATCYGYGEVFSVMFLEPGSSSAYDN